MAEAPLRTLTADVGLADCSQVPARPAVGSSSSAPVEVSLTLTNRVRKLEQAMSRIREDLQAQAQEPVGIATGYARTDKRLFVQNNTIAVVHFAMTHDEGHTIFGWRFATVRRNGLGPAFRILHDLVDPPVTMLCEKYLPTERAIALSVLDVDVSGDES